MPTYFPEKNSVAARLGNESVDQILSIIANRYIGENPALPYVYRSYSNKGFRQQEDGRYDLNVKDRLPAVKPGQFAYAFGLIWSDDARSFELTISCYGPTQLQLNGNLVYKSNIVEEVNDTVKKTFPIELQAGWNELLLKFCSSASGFGCVIGSSRNKLMPVDILSPFQEREGQAGWVYSEATELDLFQEKIALAYGDLEAASPLRWYPDSTSDLLERPFIENPLFGRWNYPLGVTLYGLLQAGKAIERPDVVQYAIDHIAECVEAYPYAMWSKEQYGYPSINHHLVEMTMLDDCGSFGSAMLEAYFTLNQPGSLQIADEIADYILNRQERKADGAFYREQKGYFMEDTLWADDLYMSIPFLIRYSKLRERPDCLDEAARQFLLFRDYLYMPTNQLMSHVYAFKYNTATGVPWGRGNGWVLFSLAELLTELPRTHPSYESILSFFLELSQGVLAVQGENGLWHQVLTEKDAYEETSCTAMFVYTFARGVRLQLYPQPDEYEQAAERGWAGLTKYSIDQQGNVHGVCQGSRFSFSSDYYKYELPWRTNDTHGIGIVLLAGVEMAKLGIQRRD